MRGEAEARRRRGAGDVLADDEEEAGESLAQVATARASAVRERGALLVAGLLARRVGGGGDGICTRRLHFNLSDGAWLGASTGG